MTKPKQQKERPKQELFYKVFAASALILSITNIAHHEYHHDESVSETAASLFEAKFLRDSFSSSMKKIDEILIEKKKDHELVTKPQQRQEKKKEERIEGGDGLHELAGLSCKDHGGPNDDEIVKEMIFWSDIESDSTYRSHFYDPDNVKYMTFEPDHGGWNNIRMAMETVLVLAHATGRTLVMPPEQRMYLLGKGGGKKHFTFNDFFSLDSIALEHEGLNVISMEEFLTKVAMKGQLERKPPEDRVNWNGKSFLDLWTYLREVGTVPQWDPTTCVAAIPSSSDPKDIDYIRSLMSDIITEKNGVPRPKLEDYIGKPIPVDASPMERLREILAEARKELCPYDTELQNSLLIHFSAAKGTRLLSHYYAFVFFQDWKQDLWSKRFVRDHVRYIDEIMCAANRVVNGVRERAKLNNKKRGIVIKNSERSIGGEEDDGVVVKGALYDSMHVRRGDFQYKKTRLEAIELYRKSKDELTEGITLFIATDERDKTFFKPLMDHYDVCFLDDFAHLLKGINSNYYGMIDQLVASRGRVFFGTWFSTLSGYVNRMRGYYIVKHKLRGHEEGTMDSYYFTPPDRKFQMVDYRPVKLPLYMREFPTSWRDIDQGIDEI